MHGIAFLYLMSETLEVNLPKQKKLDLLGGGG